jgi:hypothetical protein
MGVTWNNQPAATPTNQINIEVDYYFPEWLTIDITALVQDAINAGQTAIGILIRDSVEDDGTHVDAVRAWFNSKEGTYPSSLEITYEEAPPPPQEFTLNVNSSPIIGIPVTVNDPSYRQYSNIYKSFSGNC